MDEKTNVQSVADVDIKNVEMEGAVGCKIQWLINKPQAEHFAMRRFTIEANGHTPYHNHTWEHEVYVLSGKGIIILGKEKKEVPLNANDVIYVAPEEKHQFKNASDNVEFTFLCLIPLKK